MEEQEKNVVQDELFAKGFNAGYLLSQHEPELLDKILVSIQKETVYSLGLKEGKKKRDHEKQLELKKDTNIGSQDREMDR